MPPPTNIGFVDPSASQPGGVDVQGQVGGGGQYPVGGPGAGGAAHVEAFVTPKVSIPVGVNYIRTQEGNFTPIRVGVRHRATPRLAYGAGLGGSMGFEPSGVFGAGTADVELVLAARQPRWTLSAGLRPGLAFASDTIVLVALAEPALAIHVTQSLSITTTVPLGVWYWPHDDWLLDPVGSFFGAATLGVHRRF